MLAHFACCLLVLHACATTTPPPGPAAREEPPSAPGSANFTTGSFVALVRDMALLFGNSTARAECPRGQQSTVEACFGEAVRTMVASATLLDEIKAGLRAAQLNAPGPGRANPRGSDQVSSETPKVENEKILLHAVNVFLSVRGEILEKAGNKKLKNEEQDEDEFLDDLDLSPESFAYFLAEIIGTFVGLSWGFISTIIAIIDAMQEE